MEHNVLLIISLLAVVKSFGLHEQQALEHHITRDCSFAVQQLTFNTDFPFRISQPGLYCIGSNVGISPNGVQVDTNVIPLNASPAIIIQSNNVILDLNGFSMRGSTNNMIGIMIMPGYSGIIVRNGVISGMGGAAIRMNNTTNNYSLLLFDNITFIDNAMSIQLIGANGFTITNCLSVVRSTQLKNSQGFSLQNCNYGSISTTKSIQNNIAFSLNNSNDIEYASCSAYKSGAQGFYQQAGASISYVQCHAYDSTANGFCCMNDAKNGLARYGTFRQCSALRNTLDGFYLQMSDSVVQECQSSNNHNGFTLYGNANSVLDNVAQNNAQSGFCIIKSQSISTLSNQFRNNTAISNATGFLDQTPLINKNHFYSNFANANNTVDYSGIQNVVTSPAATLPMNSTANIAE